MADAGLFQLTAEYISRLWALIVASVVGEGGAGLTNVIVGNAASAGAMVTDSISGAVKTQKRILLIQTLSQFFYAASSIVLKGYSAAVQNVVAIVRNLVAIKGTDSRTVEFTLIAAPVILGILFNNRGAVGLLPVMANLIYSIGVFRYAAEPVKLKIAFIICNAMFVVFNFAVLNFVGGISAIVICVTTLVSVVKTKKS